MNVKCNKCKKDIKVSVWEYFREKLICSECGNEIIINNCFRKICRLIEFVLTYTLFYLLSCYLKEIISVTNVFERFFLYFAIPLCVAIGFHIFIHGIFIKTILTIYINAKK